MLVVVGGARLAIRLVAAAAMLAAPVCAAAQSGDRPRLYAGSAAVLNGGSGPSAGEARLGNRQVGLRCVRDDCSATCKAAFSAEDLSAALRAEATAEMLSYFSEQLARQCQPRADQPGH